METHSQCRQTWSNSAFQLSWPDLIWQFVEQKNMPVTTVWVSVPKYKRTSGLHLSTKRHKNNHTDKEKHFILNYAGWFVFSTFCFGVSNHTCAQHVAETSSEQWQLGRRIQSADGNNVTYLTLSSLASISTTSVSTSSIFALENKYKGRFVLCRNCFYPRWRADFKACLWFPTL